MKKRGAIELSANFLVIIIISMVILALGFALFRGILGKTSETTAFLDDRIKNQIEDLLMNSGERVVLPINRYDAYAGDMIAFGVGVTNVLGGSAPVNFWFKAECNNVISPSYCNGVENVNWIDKGNPFALENSERQIIEVVVDFKKNAAKGLYVFDAKVCYNDNNAATTSSECTGLAGPDLYGRFYKVYINLK